MESTKKIYKILQKLIGLHRQMLETVRLEREALSNADLKGVNELTSSKEALLAAIRQQESERLKAVAELAIDWKKQVRELTLTNIIIQIQGKDLKEAETFRSALNALSLLVKRVQEQNSDNREFVERSLVHVQNMKQNILGQAAPLSQTYSNRGKKVTTTASSRMLSKEV